MAIPPWLVCRNLNGLRLNRLPTSRLYKRLDERWQRYQNQLAGNQLKLDVKFIAPLKAAAKKRFYQFTTIDAWAELLGANQRRQGATDTATFVGPHLLTLASNRTFDPVVFCFWTRHVTAAMLGATVARPAVAPPIWRHDDFGSPDPCDRSRATARAG